MKMKLLIGLLFSSGFIMNAQTAQKIGLNPTMLDNSAILEVESTAKGFLPPRMTTEDRDKINKPAVGLVIYNTTTKKLEIWDGISWSAGDGGSNNNSHTKFLRLTTSEGIAHNKTIFNDSDYFIVIDNPYQNSSMSLSFDAMGLVTPGRKFTITNKSSTKDAYFDPDQYQNYTINGVFYNSNIPNQSFAIAPGKTVNFIAASKNEWYTYNLENDTAIADLNMGSKNIANANKISTTSAQISKGTDGGTPTAGQVATAADANGNIIWKSLTGGGATTLPEFKLLIPTDNNPYINIPFQGGILKVNQGVPANVNILLPNATDIVIGSTYTIINNQNTGFVRLLKNANDIDGTTKIWIDEIEYQNGYNGPTAQWYEIQPQKTVKLGYIGNNKWYTF